MELYWEVDGTQPLKVDGNIIIDHEERLMLLILTSDLCLLMNQMKSYLIKVLAHTHSWKMPLLVYLPYSPKPKYT